MKIDDVPQDNGMIANYGHEICYAVDDQGKYVLSPSLGWEPKNIVNSIAWDVIHQQVADVLKQMHDGKLSTLAFHMVKNQMDVKLLAQYVRLPRWKVKRHLKPDGFKGLGTALLNRYADVFDIPVDQLLKIPEYP
jgi:hypothetical protein